MTRELRKKRLIGLAAVAVLILVAMIAAISSFVYLRLAAELRSNAEEALTYRLIQEDEFLIARASAAVDQAYLLMAAAVDATFEEEEVAASIAAGLGLIQANIPGCTAAWIALEDGSFIASNLTTSPLVAGKSWWRSYLGDGPAVHFGELGGRGNLGYAGRPMRDDIDLNTLIPVVVPYHVGTRLKYTAFFELSLTYFIENRLDRMVFGGKVVNTPIRLSIYDPEGRLVETSANIPVVRERTFAESRDLECPSAAQGEIEVFHRDDRLSLVFSASVSEAAVMGGARRISAGVLVLGGSAALALLVLGSFIVASLRRYARLERMEIIARFDALKAKVDPHFLFNTLDGMVGLIETKDLDGLTETVRALAFMLRSSVRGREDEIPLREEIEYVRSYLHLQRIRYGSTFKAIFDIPPEALERRVLRFSIQPLVENSFRHGIHEGSVGVSIRISARLDDAGLTVEVSDDGPGTEPEMIAALAAIFRNGGTELGASGGLANVHARLRLKYGPPFGLSLIAQEKGFGIRMLTLGPSIVAEAASGPQPLAGRSAATGPKPNYFR